ncbi:protein DA1-like [Argentina anserina]|uniref:protein DA1-like n=1 Tax=Argentina anserina TaxID=57926 RepID=UPI0021763E74|nr:protein DA1-like [Potentilla anserina]
MDLPNDVPVFLVDTKEMARLCDGQFPGMVFGLMFEGTVTSVTNCSRKGNRIVVEQMSDECGTGIAILFGLPKIMTQAILTHEMMHVYFRSKGIESGKLERKLEEGMCQVVGWKWLDWLDNEINSSSSAHNSHEQTQFLRKLVETYKFVVEKHNSYEYGEGFREVQLAVAEHGLQTTIDHLITEKKLPE